MFSLRSHGGSCCGVKHIASFEEYAPDSILCDLPYSGNGNTPDSMYRANNGTGHLLPGSYYCADMEGDYGPLFKEYKKEIAVLRLFRLLDQCVRIWSAQRVEVTLIHRQLPTWGKILKKIGFVELPESRNSNTGRLIHTFWLIYDQGDKEKKVPSFLETYGPEWQEINDKVCGVKKKPVKKAPFR